MLELEQRLWPLGKRFVSYGDDIPAVGLHLVDHCIDVAAFAEALWRDTDCRKKEIDSSLHSLSCTDLARVCFFVGLHDAGKVNHGFQDVLKEDRGVFSDHTSVLYSAAFGYAARTCSVYKPLRYALGVSQWGPWFRNTEEAVSSWWNYLLDHHCKRPLEPGVTVDPSLWERRGNRDPCAALENVVEVMTYMFGRDVLAGAGSPCLRDDERFLVGLKRLVVSADRLASRWEEDYWRDGTYLAARGTRLSAA